MLPPLSHVSQEIPPNPLDTILDPVQQSVVKEWLGKWKEDFIAHAVWGQNFASIVTAKAVLPAEAILRTQKAVEREFGMYGARDIEILPQLTKEDLEKLEVIDPKEELELQNLLKEQAKDPFTQADKAALIELKGIALQKAKELCFNETNFENIPSDYQIKNHLFKFKIFKKLDIEVSHCLPVDSFAKYEILVEKCERDKDIKSIQRKRQGICTTFIHNFRRDDVIRELVAKYNSKTHLIQIAYDQQKNGTIPHFFAKKLQHYRSKNLDASTLQSMECYFYEKYRISLKITSVTIASEIRTLKNKIAWSYGNIAVLRGKSEEVVSTLSLGAKSSWETCLKHPIENNGEFFALPLAHPNTLILGSAPFLSIFSNQLDALGAKYVYSENLTDEQRAFFGIT